MKSDLPVRSLLGEAVEGGAQRRVLGAMDERAADIALAMRKGVPFLMRQSVPIEPELSKLSRARDLEHDVTLAAGPVFSVPLATDPGGSRAMLIFDRNAVAFLLEGALGGSPDDAENGESPELTSPQRAVMTRIADSMLKAVSESLGPLGVKLRRLPATMGSPPEGQFAAITFTLGGPPKTEAADENAVEGFGAPAEAPPPSEKPQPRIVFALGRDALSNAGLGLFTEARQRDDSSKRIPQVLSEVELDVVVELGRVRRKLGEIDSLKVGDVIRLGSIVRQPVILRVQGHPVFRGKPTTSGTQLAVSILERVTGESSAQQIREPDVGAQPLEALPVEMVP